MQIESTTNGTMAEVILKLVFAFPLLSLSIDWLIDVKGESTLDTTRHDTLSTIKQKNLF